MSLKGNPKGYTVVDLRFVARATLAVVMGALTPIVILSMEGMAPIQIAVWGGVSLMPLTIQWLPPKPRSKYSWFWVAIVMGLGLGLLSWISAWLAVGAAILVGFLISNIIMRTPE